MGIRDLMRRGTVAALMTIAASPTLADAIDGEWCAPEGGERMAIDGPSITTPAGTRTTGSYSRHAFSYVVPEGDPGAGGEIDMQLLNEEEVRVFVPGGAPVIWRRCQLNV